MSILDTVQSATNIKPDKGMKIKALLIGASGTGKTTGCTTLPGKKLQIDLDGRVASLAGFDIDVCTILEEDPNKPKAWTNLEKLLKEIWIAVNRKTFPYDSISIDGISAMCRYSMNWSLLLTGSDNNLMSRSPGGGPAQPHYYPSMFRMDRFINSVLALPLNVCFTAHEDLFEDKRLKTLTYYPKITGKLRTEIANWFNESYLTTTTRGGDRKIKYIWSTISSGSRRPFVKSAMNKLGAYWNDPIEVDFSQPLKGFEYLLDKRFGNKEVCVE